MIAQRRRMEFDVGALRAVRWVDTLRLWTRARIGTMVRGGWLLWLSLAAVLVACNSGEGVGNPDVSAASDAAIADSAVELVDASIESVASLWALREVGESWYNQWGVLELTLQGDGPSLGQWRETPAWAFRDCECLVNGGLEVRREGASVHVQGYIATPDPYSEVAPTSCEDVRFLLSVIDLRLEGSHGEGALRMHADSSVHVTCALAQREADALLSDCGFFQDEAPCVEVRVEARALRAMERECSPAGEWLIPGSGYDLRGRGLEVDSVRIAAFRGGSWMIRDRQGIEPSTCGEDTLCAWTGEASCVLQAQVAQWVGASAPPLQGPQRCGDLHWHLVELHLAPPEPWAVVRPGNWSCSDVPPPADGNGAMPADARRIYRLEP